MTEAEQIIEKEYNVAAVGGCTAIAKLLNDKGLPCPYRYAGQWRYWDVRGVARRLKKTWTYVHPNGRRNPNKTIPYIKDRGIPQAQGCATGIKDPHAMPFEELVSQIKPREPKVMINLYEDHWSDTDFRPSRWGRQQA